MTDLTKATPVQAKAYSIGFTSASAGKASPAYQNQELMALVKGLMVGCGAAEIFKMYNAGILDGLGL